MANRYWILGTGTWDATNTVNWSDASGGLGGFSVPTASDNVFFDANSNVGTTAFTVLHFKPQTLLVLIQAQQHLTLRQQVKL